MDRVGIEQAGGAAACLVCDWSQLHGLTTTQLSWNALSNNYAGPTPPCAAPDSNCLSDLLNVQAPHARGRQRGLDLLCVHPVCERIPMGPEMGQQSWQRGGRVSFAARGNSCSIDLINLFNLTITSGSLGDRLRSLMPENKCVLLVHSPRPNLCSRGVYFFSGVMNLIETL